MRKILIPVTLMMVALCGFKAADEIYVLDVAKSRAVWTGYASTGGYAPNGTVALKSGKCTVRNSKIVAAAVVIDMTRISHENKDMEAHLKNEDFFDVKKYPAATFQLISMRDNMATGWLTIKNIRKKLTFPVKLLQKDNGLTITASLKIDRTQFEIKYNSESYFQDLGSYAIKNEFDLNLELWFVVNK